MRWINRAIVMVAVLAVSAVAAWAQDTCTDELKTAKYSEWYDNRKDKQDVAYKAASDFLAACPSEAEDGPWGPQVKALKKFKKDYDALNSNKELADKFQAAVTAKNYADQIRLGKQLVAMPSHADNAVIYIIMAGAGLGDANQLAESAQAATKAIELIEAGKPFAPAYPTKEQALAAMNYIIAKATVKTSPADAITYYIKAAKADNKNAQIYGELAEVYAGQVEKLTAQYQTFVGKPETNESKLALLNLNQEVDRQIDALARAAAVTTNAADKKNVMEALTELYKFRNKTDAGVDQLVANILSKPLPDAPKPITELPATPTPSPTPGGTSATPTNGSGNGSAAGGSSTTGAAKPTSTPTTTTAKPAASGSTTPAKPTATPKPRPRQRANHRG